MNKDNYIRLLEAENLELYEFNKEIDEIDTERINIINNIRKYVENVISDYNETIDNYIDDDYKNNKDFINELREDKEHWVDILKICNMELDILYRKDYLD